MVDKVIVLCASADKWSDKELQKRVDYYLNHPEFWTLPSNSKLYFMEAKKFRKRAIEQELEYLNESKYRINGRMFPYLPPLPPDPSWGLYKKI